MLYDLLNKKDNVRKIAVLIDPDKSNFKSIFKTVEICEKCGIKFIMVGGSLVSDSIDYCIDEIKKNSKLPVVLFPGSLLQISNKADAILLLSLISGRNPEYLIGNHVIASPILRKSKLEILPTGYMLVESGKVTSVQYISNTCPIPADKLDIAVATAVAGEMLGFKLIYLEAGSGAIQHVPVEMISAVKRNISVPLIVGGGIKTRSQLDNIFDAGADIVVIGNSLENNPDRLFELVK
jgi:putative glycerol-1-phosphate prenyltransferase